MFRNNLQIYKKHKQRINSFHIYLNIQTNQSGTPQTRSFTSFNADIVPSLISKIDVSLLQLNKLDIKLTVVVLPEPGGPCTIIDGIQPSFSVTYNLFFPADIIIDDNIINEITKLFVYIIQCYINI